MTTKETTWNPVVISELKTGQIIRHKSDGKAYIITDTFKTI